jgi:hypothetical protein
MATKTIMRSDSIKFQKNSMKPMAGLDCDIAGLFTSCSCSN